MARFQLPFQLPRLPHLGRRATLAVRYGGIGLLTIIVFLFALQFTFPYDRVRDKAIEAMSGSYDVTIGNVERGIIPGRVYFKGVTLRSRPTKADDPITTFYIEKVQVDLGLFALIGMTASIDLDAKLGSGHVKGNISLPKFGKNGVKIDLAGRDIPGSSLPMAGLIGLPMTGKLDFDFELDLPMTKNKMGRSLLDWTKADGLVDLECPSNCTIGDGHSKLRPLLKNRTNQVMVQDGIAFDKVNLDSLTLHGVWTPANGDPEQHSSNYKPGKFELTKFEVKSKDGELHVDYAMTMAQEFGESIVAGCLRFKPSETLLKKEETKRTYAALSTTGAEIRSDGLFHIKLTDRFKDMKRLNQECGANVKTVTNGEDFTARPGGRPNLDVHDDNGSGTIRTGIGTTGRPMPMPAQAEPAPTPPPAPTPTALGSATAGPPPPPPPEGSAGSAGSAVEPPAGLAPQKVP